MSLALHPMVNSFVLICFARASSQLNDFDNRNKILTA